MIKIKTIFAVSAATLALGACATPTPYQPLNPSNADAGGYKDTEIDAHTARVSFSGNSITSRETVENYLLYRAAELTIAKGFDWFKVVDRETDKKTDTYVGSPPIGYASYGGWRPYWRYHGARFGGWRGWDPYRDGVFFADEFDVHSVDRFEVSAEISMHEAPKPSAEDRAFDAHDVLAHVGPMIAAHKGP